MRALVVGYGSIGQRHARLLAEHGLSVAVVSRRVCVHPESYGDLLLALDDWQPDYVVIASRTHEHHDDLSRLAAAGFSGLVLVEKPLFHGALPIPENQFRRAYVAFNLRFHPVTQTLRATVDGRKKLAAHAYVGQHLPDWRPNQDYRASYSANREAGGGVLRDLCHELDYLNWILGEWEEVTALGGQFSQLEIDSDDVYSVLFRTTDCPVASVAFNYLDDRLHRDVIILTDEGTARADFVAGTVTFESEVVELQNICRDSTYQAQHSAILSNDDTVLCSLEDGWNIVHMIDAAETANRAGAWVQRQAQLPNYSGTLKT